MANFYKKVAETAQLDIAPKALEKQFVRGPLAWVKAYKTMTSDSNSGAARLSFTEITGLKFVDEIDNKQLIEGFVYCLGNQKKIQQ